MSLAPPPAPLLLCNLTQPDLFVQWSVKITHQTYVQVVFALEISATQRSFRSPMCLALDQEQEVLLTKCLQESFPKW